MSIENFEVLPFGDLHISSSDFGTTRRESRPKWPA